MDNWLFLLLGLILGIPLSIFANMLTPSVISYFKNRSLSRRERKLKEIIYRYKKIKGCKDNPILLIVMIYKNISSVLLFLVSMIMGFGILSLPNTVINNPVTENFWGFMRILVIFVMLYFGSSFLLWQSRDICVDVESFDKYKRRVISEIISLRGNPEDLDKEETA